MRVLMLSDFYPPALGGVEQHVRDLSESLVRRDHEVAVATLRFGDNPRRDSVRGVQVFRLQSSAQRVERLFRYPDRAWAPPLPDPELTWALRRVIAEVKPDIVHGHDWLARSFLPLRPGSGAAFVLTLHYYTLSCAKKNLLHFEQVCSGPRPAKCLRCAAQHYGPAKGTVITTGNWLGAAAERAAADYVIAVSHATAIGNGFAHTRVPWEVIPNFVVDGESGENDDAYLRQLPTADFILFAGDVRPAKGIDVLLSAYAGLPNPPPLVLIGKTWPDTPTNLPPNVQVLGPWPQRAVRAAWSRCQFGVAPSIWPEPFGLVLIEAMAAGCPMIASNIGGMSEVVVDGETGLLVPPRDAPALRDAMAQLLTRPGLRQRLAVASPHQAERYREAAVVPRIEAVYAAARGGGQPCAAPSGNA